MATIIISDPSMDINDLTRLIPAEIAYHLLSFVDAKTLDAYCFTSKENLVYLSERSIRVRALVNTYSRHPDPFPLFFEAVTSASSLTDLEELEALLRVHPEYLQRWLLFIDLDTKKKISLPPWLWADNPSSLYVMLSYGLDPNVTFQNYGEVLGIDLGLETVYNSIQSVCSGAWVPDFSTPPDTKE